MKKYALVYVHDTLDWPRRPLGHIQDFYSPVDNVGNGNGGRHDHRV